MTRRLLWCGQNWTRCRIPRRRTFGRIPWHVIPEPPATLQGAATWQIQCHDPRAMCHIAGCCHRANSTACYPRATYHIAGCCNLVNSLSWFQSHCRVQVTWRNQCPDRATLQGVIIPFAILKIVFRHIFSFFNAVWALTSGGLGIVLDTLVLIYAVADEQRHLHGNG